MNKFIGLILASVMLLSGTADAQNIYTGNLPRGGLMQQTDQAVMTRNGITMQANPFTMPTNGSILVSNGTLAPIGLQPTNGNCAVGNGTAWTSTACPSSTNVTNSNATTAITGSIARSLAQHFTDVVNATDQGVVCDGTAFTDGNINNSSSTLSSYQQYDFTNADVGKTIVITDINETVILTTTIASVSGGDAVLTAPWTHGSITSNNARVTFYKTDNTAALQGVLNNVRYLNAAGYNQTGYTVMLPDGICGTGPLTQYRQTFFQCTGGTQACELFLKSNSNAPLLTSENYSSLTGTGANYTGAAGPVPSWFGIHGVHLDCNKAGQSGGDCIDYYGNMEIIDQNSLIENSYQDGVHTEAANASAYNGTDWLAQEEGFFQFISRNNGRYGWEDWGPHDQVIQSYISYNNASYAWYQNVNSDYSGVAHIVKMHAYTQQNGKNYYIGAGGTAQEIYNDYGQLEMATAMDIDEINTTNCGYDNLDCIQIDPSATFWHIGHANINMGSGNGGAASTVTISIASPAVVTWSSHPPLAVGQMVIFSTSGTLPTGITGGTEYFVSATGLGTNSFEIATTRANAIAGTPAVNTSGSQSGTQTATSVVNGFVVLGGGGGVGSFDNIIGTPQNPSGIVTLVDIEAPFITGNVLLADNTTTGSTCLKIGAGYPVIGGIIEGCYNAVDPTNEYGGIINLAQYGNTNSLKAGTSWNTYNSIVDPFGSGTFFGTLSGLSVIGAATIGSNTSGANSLTVNTNINGGLSDISSNTDGAAFILDSTGGGGHAWQFLATGSNNTPGWFAAYDETTNSTPFAVNGSITAPQLNTNALTVIGWSNSVYSNGASDTGMSRKSADVIAFGNGTQGDTTALLISAGNISAGTKFSTTTGTSCGTVGTLTGGATAGTYVSNAATCTVVLVMGGLTAPNGWSCRATDLTTSADAFLQKQTASTTTTATLTGTTVSGDVVSFSCMGY